MNMNMRNKTRRKYYLRREYDNQRKFTIVGTHIQTKVIDNHAKVIIFERSRGMRGYVE